MSLRKTFQRQVSRSDGKKKNEGVTSPLPIFDNLENEQLLTAEQLAERLNIAVKTVQKWRYEKVLPAEAMVKLRHQVRYRWGMVLRWLNSKEN
jgi:DNA-binding transcriptional regulator YiaG